MNQVDLSLDGVAQLKLKIKKHLCWDLIWSYRWPMALFFLSVDGSAISKDRILILLEIGQMTLKGRFLHCFKITKVVEYNFQPIGITSSPIFFKGQITKN